VERKALISGENCVGGEHGPGIAAAVDGIHAGPVGVVAKLEYRRGESVRLAGWYENARIRRRHFRRGLPVQRDCCDDRIAGGEIRRELASAIDGL
jgi:hypothetical protein